jgi:hypothetical protein
MRVNGRQTDIDRRTDISKLFVAFRNFANSSKNNLEIPATGVYDDSNGTTTTTDFNSLYRVLSSGM